MNERETADCTAEIIAADDYRARMCGKPQGELHGFPMFTALELGKSFLASYLGFKAIEAGYSVIFISMNNLSQLLRTEAILSRSKAQMKRIRNCDLFT